VDKGHRRANQAPADHDASDPQLRPDFMQQDIARYFKDHIADKENTRAQTIDGITE
jgi:hypothetical protein